MSRFCYENVKTTSFTNVFPGKYAIVVKNLLTREPKYTEPLHRKTWEAICVSDHVRLKPACTVTEACKKLEISDLRKRGTVLSA